MESAPIACTLSTTDLAAIKERYREAASHYQASARFTDANAVISLTGDQSFLRSLLDEMVAREGDCCAFLTFDITATGTGYDVVLGIRDADSLTPDLLHESIATLFPPASRSVTHSE